MKICITGNIGSGKSTVCAMLAKALPDYTVFSVDDAVRGLYDNTAYCQDLWRTFGTHDRKALSDMVFATPELRTELEALASKHIVPVIEAALVAPRVIVEFPLLFEMPGWAERFDHVIALRCAEATQRERVLARDAMPVDKFERVRAAQLSTDLKAVLADSVIDTDLPLPALNHYVLSLAPELRRKALLVRCANFFGSKDIADAVDRAYDDISRHYHDLTHLQELFDHLDPFLADNPHAWAIEAAVWFHDFVYVTSRHAYADNERMSARALYHQCRKYAPALLRDPTRAAEVLLACEIILGTKGHEVKAPGVLAKPQAKAAAELFLDADLAILAAETPRLLRYDDGIVKEWDMADKATPEFCNGRADALETFLTRPTLYYSPAFAHLDAPARVNLQRLADRWRTVATS